jgi:hypothetical protein
MRMAATRDKNERRKGAPGQVLLEYLLMLIVALSVVLLLQSSFRGTIYRLWVQLAKEIAASCPSGCAPPPNVR